MKNHTHFRDHTPQRKTREDHSSTRSLLLTVGGQLFAEKGFDRTTGKEICELAGANTAAINYYFGGMEGLYASVLLEAHRQLVTMETLSEIVAAEATAQAKLEAIFSQLVDAFTEPSASSWMLRVIGREIVAPSPFLSSFSEQEVLPKCIMLKVIVAELMGLPEEHPAVTRGAFFVIAPCIMMLINDRETMKLLNPHFGFEKSDNADIVRQMMQFVLGGLAAIEAAEVKLELERKI
jgi:TetR/AcrR family transcriptional regulator, regulator of cefoperazone and chloramphenicol sensitivity